MPGQPPTARPGATAHGQAVLGAIRIAVFAGLFLVVTAPAAESAHWAGTSRVDALRGVQPLVSHNLHSAPSNAPASDPAISQDNRTAVALAYVSAATDIVDDRTGGRDNIYLVHRARPFGLDAEQPWGAGSTELVSRGTTQPDGDSWDPTLDGDDRHAASCLAFVSRATNLTTGDTNDKADVFVRPLRRSGLRRIATRGNANSVAVDGGCDDIAIGTDAGLFLVAKGRKPKRISGGNARSATIDTYARSGSFERSGHVYHWFRSGRVRRIASGTNPVISANGKWIAYESGGKVRAFNTGTRRSMVLGIGKQPSLTLTGVFAFWVSGPLVDATGLRKPAASCSSGPGEPATSAHGNYVVFTCADETPGNPHAQIHVSYIGER